MRETWVAVWTVICLVALAVIISIPGLGATTTEVRLSAENEVVGPGETVTYDVVVGNADGGVGSFNLTVTSNDTSMATITNVSYADSPSYASEPDGGKSARLTATGMDTINSGAVTVATVTIRAENSGTATLAVSVAALGDESGNNYTISNVRGRELTVQDEATLTPTATPTPTSTSSGNDDSDDDDDDSGSDGSEDESTSGDGESTRSSTTTERPTPTPTTVTTDETPGVTTTPAPTTDPKTDDGGGGAASPTGDPETDNGDDNSDSVMPVAVGVVVLLVLLGTIVAVRLRD